VNRRSFFKWMTAVGAALVLPSSVRPFKRWSLVEDVGPLVFGRDWELHAWCDLIEGPPNNGYRTYRPGSAHWEGTAHLPTLLPVEPSIQEREFAFCRPGNKPLRGRGYVTALEWHARGSTLTIHGTGPLVTA
jgi:hypothetical protein